MKYVVAGVLSTFLLTGCLDVANGEKIGNIVKIAKQGVICPTYEAELIRGGFNGGSGVNGSSFHFTIENPAVVAQIEQAMNEQKEVKIVYTQEFATFCRSESNNYFVTSVTTL